MSPLENPAHVEQLARRLHVVVEDLTRLDDHLRAAHWGNQQLEDLELATALLRQVQDLLMRHARRWRLGDR